MVDNVTLELEQWLTASLQSLAPAHRRKILNQLSKQLRQSQQHRIQLQKNADGSVYVARKRSNIKTKSRRVKTKMFQKLRTTKYLKASATVNSAEVSFNNARNANIAEIHQFGLREKLGKRQKIVKYPSRELLGFTESDESMIGDVLIEALSR